MILWKQQTLLNIVKLRYMDLPVFVDVSSIVAGYSMQTGVNINGTLSSKMTAQGNFASIGGTALYTDRPTRLRRNCTQLASRCSRAT